MYYFDYAATTPICEEVKSVYLKTQEKYFANTMALHIMGEEANLFYERQKSDLMKKLKITNYEAVYVSNATEANNLALFGYLKSKKGNIISLPIEHSSIDEAVKEIDKENKDINVKWAKVNNEGIIDLDDLEKQIDKDTLLVCCHWVNNVIGSVEPIDKIINIIKKYPRCKLLVDIVQGIGKQKPNFNFNDIDFMTFSTHKIYGPKGVGVLLYKKNINLSPILFGAKDQQGLKPGTFDPALVSATTKAVEIVCDNEEKWYDYVKSLRDDIVSFIKENGFLLNSPENASPYIINFSIPKRNGETIIHALEAKGIMVSTGSACNSHLKTPDRVLKFIGKDDDTALSAVRISLSHLVEKEDINALKEAIKEIK